MKYKKENILILVDDREGNVLIKDLEDNNLTCEVKRLKSADYVYRNIGFERKTINDFCASIIDGRLESQVFRMKETYKLNFVLVSGRIADRTSKINENCIIGKIISLMLKHNVRVLFAESDKQMAYMIRKIIDLSREMKEDEYAII